MFCAIPLSMASLPEETPSPIDDSDDRELLPQGLPKFRGASSPSRAVKMWPSLLLPTLRVCRLASCGLQSKEGQWRAITRMAARRRLRRGIIL